MFAFTHLGIIVYLTSAFAKSQKPAEVQTAPSISVIIAARDEEQNLKKLIHELLNQSYSDFEIVIALDRCTDESEALLRSFQSKKITPIVIDQVPEDWNPKKHALNQAIEQANGDWLVMTDADCIPQSNNWLNEIANQTGAATDIIIGTSPYLSGNSFLSKYIRFESFVTAFLYTSKAILYKPYMAVGRNLAIRESFFNQVGGYESIKSVKGGDDDLFIQKNVTPSNSKVLLGEESLVLTYPKQTWQSYINQKLRHLSVGHRYSSKDQAFLTLFHTSQLLFLTILPFNSLRNLIVLLLFYLFIKLVSYRFAAIKMGFGINYMLLPLVDMLYAVLTPFIALRSKLVKDITWKN